jgi:hypothetical protein
MSPIREIPIFHSPYHADQWPIQVGFAADGWTRLWNEKKIRLDPYLKLNKDPITNLRVPWTREEVFKGAFYRLTIDIRKSLATFPTLTHGMIITCQDWDCDGYHYFIDHCIYKDKTYAYLKVVCFDKYHYSQDVWFS